ncbi:MAG: HAD-IIIA family hydrolase [Flavobacteriaceae bacterium]|nr:HAD-IIIA family hydrolase [Flavobacteriaceae bacterium]
MKNYKEILPEITTLIFDIDGVLTDGTVTIFPNGELIRKMNIKDGYALKTAVDMGFNICIISGGNNKSVLTRLQNLGIKDIYLGVHTKTNQLYEYLENNQLKLENVLYMGDDIPDYQVMELVALPTCPQDAAPEIKNIAKYVSHKKGGNGAVRDIIEQVLKVQGKWSGNFNATTD